MKIVNPPLEEIINCVRNWVQRIASDFPTVTVEILLDNEEKFRAAFTSSKAMAEVFVENPDWTPYRNVAFQSMGLEKDDDTPYFWYDSEGDSLASIEKQLNQDFLRYFT